MVRKYAKGETMKTWILGIICISLLLNLLGIKIFDDGFMIKNYIIHLLFEAIFSILYFRITK